MSSPFQPDAEGPLASGCQQTYECRQGKRAGETLYETAGVTDCMRYCQGTPACEFYTFGTGSHSTSTSHYIGDCHVYEDCDRKKWCPDCASGSMADCKVTKAVPEVVTEASCTAEFDENGR